jgi:putative ABC transport system permease protein
MKLPVLALLSVKYLLRYRRRYFFLFLALSVSFAVVTLITAVKDGMYANVYRSAQDHYAGDIVAVGQDGTYGNNYHLPAEAKGEVYRALEAARLEPEAVVERTQYGENGTAYYNGAAVRLKYVTGVDWEREAFYFDGLAYRERDEAPAGEDTIVLSAPVAELLGARTGDGLVLEVDTRYGQKNTGYFIVGGVVEDATIFGYYKAYVGRAALNRLMLFEDEDCSVVGIFIKERGDVEGARRILQAEMEKRVETGPLAYDREGLATARAVPYGGIKVFLITIPVYLSEVADLLGAMNIITYFLYAMMQVIMMVSALVTYRLVLRERRGELGTMRAIGFYGADVRFILLLETFCLAVLSLGAGMGLAMVLERAVTLVPLSWFPSFEIFLEEGRLTALYLPRTVGVNALAAAAGLFLAALWPVWGSSREPLPGMLNGGR